MGLYMTFKVLIRNSHWEHHAAHWTFALLEPLYHHIIQLPLQILNLPPAGLLLYTATYTTVEPLTKGHLGNGTFVLSSEVVLISEVHEYSLSI